MPKHMPDSSRISQPLSDQVNLAASSEAKRSLVICGPGQDIPSTVDNRHRGLMGKLADKFLDFLRKHAS